MTTAKHGTGRSANVNAGTIRRPGARLGTGRSAVRKGAVRTWGNKLGSGHVSSAKLRKGTLRSPNRYN